MSLRRPGAPAVPTYRPAVDRRTALAAGVGYVALAAVARGRPPRPEQAAFARVNHGGGNPPLLRVPQQLGTPWTLPALAVLGFLTHRPHLAVAAACALPLEKGLEVGVKKLLPRLRPAKVDPHIELRDDAPTEGPSYPSGPAAITFTVLTLAWPYLPVPVRTVGAGLAGVASGVRVHQGAHYPLDSVGGALLGVTVGSTVRAVWGRPVKASAHG